MYCVKCGQELPDDALFCSKCGMPITAQNSPGDSMRDSVSESQKTNESISWKESYLNSEPKNRNGKVFAVIGAVFTVVIVACIISVISNYSRLSGVWEAVGCYEYDLIEDYEPFETEIAFGMDFGRNRALSMYIKNVDSSDEVKDKMAEYLKNYIYKYPGVMEAMFEVYLTDYWEGEAATKIIDIMLDELLEQNLNAEDFVIDEVFPDEAVFYLPIGKKVYWRFTELGDYYISGDTLFIKSELLDEVFTDVTVSKSNGYYAFKRVSK